jgi:hypothetical protein
MVFLFFLFFFFWVFNVYGYLSKESPKFPELVCLNKHQHDFCFVLNFEFPKILVKTCMVLEERGNTPKDSWRNGFMFKGYVQRVICMKQQKKMKACHEHRKTHDLINKKGSVDKETLVEFQAKLPTKTGVG